MFADCLLPDEALQEGRHKIAKRKMLFIADGYELKDFGYLSLPSPLVKYVSVKVMPYIKEYEDELGEGIDLLQQVRFLHYLGYIQKPFIVLLNPFTRLLECHYSHYRRFVRVLNTRHVTALVVLNPADPIDALLYVLKEHKEIHDLPHIELTTSPAKAKQMISKAIQEVVQSMKHR